MTTQWDFRVLGPLEVRCRGEIVPVGAARQRVLLASLLLDMNRTVSITELIRRIWDTEPPSGARGAVQNYVSRLRRTLGAGPGGSLIASRPDGYLIEATGDELDVSRFRCLVTGAAAAMGRDDPGRCAELLREALGLWRGEPLSGVPSDVLYREIVPALAEERLHATEMRLAADLSLGRHGDLVPELADLTSRYPLRERFWAQRMLALHRSGRPSEALECYRALSAHLAGELGTDPAPALQELHQAILTGDPVLAAPPSPPGASRARLPRAAPEPRCDLPGDIPDFAGRGEELHQLLSAATVDGPAGTAAVVCAIDGMGGVGKTTLAVHASHRLASQYPDGQLYVDLHGHTQARQPTVPEHALDGLLRALGLGTEEIPHDADQRAAKWRAALAGRRVLIVLDNAASAAQVRPLLPGSPGCMAVITSRHQLMGLDLALVISLDVLPRQDALQLLSRVAGTGRVAAEPGAAAQVLDLCGHLPLAVRIAATRLRSRPAWTVGHLADRLGDRRLHELTAGDRSVAVTLALSYQYLPPDQQRLFRRLGLLPGRSFDSHLAAAVTGAGPDDAEALLEGLVDAHLLEQATAGRYRFHDLVREHARATAQRAEPADTQRGTLVRALDYYAHTAYTAGLQLNPRRERLALELTYPPSRPGVTGGPAGAVAWFESEQDNLAISVAHAGEQGLDRQAWQLAHALWWFYRMRGSLPSWTAAQETALAAARRLGDQRAEADSLRVLGIARWESSRYDDAVRCYEQALLRYRATADRIGECAALSNLGLVAWRREQYTDALRYGQLALDIAAQAGDPWVEGNARIGVGLAHWKLGQLCEALHHTERGLASYRAAGDLRGAGGALSNLGLLHRELGQLPDAVSHQQQALALMRDSGDRRGESELINDLADTCRVSGRGDEAGVLFREALRIAVDVQFRDEQARAHDGLGDLCAAADPAAASAHWQQALAIYTELGVPQADRVREKLNSGAVRQRPRGQRLLRQ